MKKYIGFDENGQVKTEDAFINYEDLPTKHVKDFNSIGIGVPVVIQEDITVSNLFNYLVNERAIQLNAEVHYGFSILSKSSNSRVAYFIFKNKKTMV